jgi:CcmD family protein
MKTRNTLARALALAVALAVTALIALPGAAFAQTTGPASAKSTVPYLFAAFGIVWLFLFGYMFFMARRQHDLERMAQEMKERLLGKR